MPAEVSGPAAVPARPLSLGNPRVRGIVIEAVLLAGVAALFIWLGLNGASNIRGATGFGFLGERAGVSLAESVIPYSPDRSYAYALLAGFANTMLVAVLGIVIASIVGLLIGVARLSHNWLISKLAAVYVETFRNIPPLLVIFFWYFGVLAILPIPKNALDLGLGISISRRGLYAPSPVWASGAIWVAAALILAVLAALALGRWAKARQMRTGQPFPALIAGIVLVGAITAAAFLAAGMPLHFDVPHKTRFNLVGGLHVAPEFVALLLALAIYTASFIAEIVRGGILSVARGQTEAAYALGLRSGPTLRRIVLPQALRVIVPPLTSEYLNLTKNTSLAVTIGFADLVAVGGDILNKTGQAVEVVAIWMAVYLGISLLTALLMNLFNRRMALAER
jgi:general L-amino acid transport system permease protein